MSTAHDLSQPVFALVDCNNFYVSCEWVFQSRLEGVPVAVLSNNDGACVARSAECKALGVKMGQPWFELKDLVKQHGLIGLSSNYTLYGDLSSRVMQVLNAYSPDVEIYSIDESFLGLERMRLLWPSFIDMGQAIRRQVRQWTGIPVCVGIAPTKTLAKLSNHIAKKNPQFNGVFDMTTFPAHELDALLSKIEVGEVWGVGSRIGAKLVAMDIKTVQDLRLSSPRMIRTHFSVVMERTVSELQGISCMSLEDVAPAKKQIVSSKSFGQMVLTFDELAEALTSYVTKAAEKLRRQDSVAGALQVFVMTNRFREQDKQYNNGVTVPLANPSNDTRSLAAAALHGLERIYRLGYWYKKCGVMLMDLSPASQRQASLFDPAGEEARQSAEMMAVVDAINGRFGRDTMKIASAVGAKRWNTRAEIRTPRYTTRWAEVPTALAS